MGYCGAGGGLEEDHLISSLPSWLSPLHTALLGEGEAGLRDCWVGWTPDKKQSPRAPLPLPSLSCRGEMDLSLRELTTQLYTQTSPPSLSPLDMAWSSSGMSPNTPAPITTPPPHLLTEEISHGSGSGGGLLLDGGSPTAQKSGVLLICRVGKALLSEDFYPASVRIGDLS